LERERDEAADICWWRPRPPRRLQGRAAVHQHSRPVFVEAACLRLGEWGKSLCLVRDNVFVVDATPKFTTTWACKRLLAMRRWPSPRQHTTTILRWQ